MVVRIINLNFVIGVWSKLLNGLMLSNENRYVFLIVVLLLQGPNPWSFQIQIRIQFRAGHLLLRILRMELMALHNGGPFTVLKLEFWVQFLIPNVCLLSGHGPVPHLCSKCLSPAHRRSVCNNSTRCRRCLCFGHFFGACISPPRSSRQSIPQTSNAQTNFVPLNSGPASQSPPRFYPSVAEYIKELNSLSSIPTPITVPWRQPWRLRAPD